MRIAAVLLILFTTVAPSYADWSFDSASGYWIWPTSTGNTYYQRTYVPACYVKGCYQNAYYSYVQVSYSPPAITINANPDDWRLEIARALKTRQSAEAFAFKERENTANFIESINAAKLNNSRFVGTYQVSNYGYSRYGTNAYSGYVAATSGNTIVGYQRSAAFFGVNADTLYQQAARHVDTAQGMAREGAADFRGLVKYHVGEIAEVEKVFARGQAAAELNERTLKAIEQPKATITEKSYTVKPTIPDSQKMPKIDEGPPKAASQTLEEFRTYVLTNCLDCHSSSAKPPKVSGGLDLDKYFDLPAVDKSALQEKIVDRLMLPSTDPKSMPRSKTDATMPGTRATARQIRMFLQN